MEKFFGLFIRSICLVGRCAQFLLILTVSHVQVIGQSIDVKQVELISDKHGLPSNTLNDILQDRQGYIWIASDDGLSRYDGVALKTFRRIEGDTNSIQSNLILDLAID